MIGSLYTFGGAVQHRYWKSFNRTHSGRARMQSQGINVSALSPMDNGRVQTTAKPGTPPLCSAPPLHHIFVWVSPSLLSGNIIPDRFDPMSTNSLVSLAAAVREALAKPQSLAASSTEEQKARLDLIDLLPELNAALVGDVEYLRELAWSVSIVSPIQLCQV
jgi:hypothetical protein